MTEVARPQDTLGYAFFAWFRLKFPDDSVEPCRGIGCPISGCSTVWHWNRRFMP
jgi:hypothetical protein